ncbi:GSCFA domain-containing protein [Niabella ginsenosidivorans]|nr:GSCFA domain-containing protein [Niabella ginsenosidivorans]
MAPIQLEKLSPPITYGDKILLVGSCFTEHIGNALLEHKFNVLQNPHGILFDPASVYHSLMRYIDGAPYRDKDLFCLNEVWQSWHHHSRFADVNKEAALDRMNQALEEAHVFLKQTDWLIITLGSSFAYRLNSNNPDAALAGLKVANCHRAPGQWFDKKMLEIDETVALLDNLYHRLRIFNPKAKILFTISPVRHLRDGVVANNRSKARLLEAVHHIVNKFDHHYYFPAYELVIDVLRDYRFYDADLAHPNYAATGFVLEKFTASCIDEASQALMKEIQPLVIARRHRPFHPQTQAHRQFLAAQYEKAELLMAKYPFLDLKEEIAYFKGDEQ